VPSLYVVHPDLPVKNLKEFVAYAKARPGQLNYGSAGNGSAGHLAFEYLKMATGRSSWCTCPTAAPARC
jgi:tripartite-type tricarboxylate transporter receptor subunit TctC